MGKQRSKKSCKLFFKNGCHLFLKNNPFIKNKTCVCVCACVHACVHACNLCMDYTHIWTGFHVCELTRMCLPQHLWTGKNSILHKDLLLLTMSAVWIFTR